MQVFVVRLDPNIPEFQRPNITDVVLQLDNTDGKIPFMTQDKPAR